MTTASDPGAPRITPVQWLIVGVAALGFAFDIYELVMMPLIARPALAELLGADQDSNVGHAEILRWTGYIMYASALSGGIFGLLGGYLTDRFGRRRVLFWSVMLYAVSPVAACFSTSPEMLLVLRCTTFVGVCVEFVAAVAWLSELFPNPRQREAMLGFTQAFSSAGGLLVTVAWKWMVAHAHSLPAIYGEHSAWRYTLLTGLIPAIPLMLLYPLLPESPAWKRKRAAGTLKRPSIAELFRPEFRRTSVVTAVLVACIYAAAFGALQLTPQIVPGLVPELSQIVKLQQQIGKEAKGSPRWKELKAQIKPLNDMQQQKVGDVNFSQELGGLCGRFALAWLAVWVVSRRKLLRIFQWPGLIVFPLVYFIAAAGNLGEHSLDVLTWSIFAAGFFNAAQMSFWGNYLPRVYPIHLRGTGEGFAANVGGRMIGTLGTPLTSVLFAPLLLANVPGITRPASVAYAAGGVALAVYLIAAITTFWLPEPGKQELPE